MNRRTFLKFTLLGGTVALAGSYPVLIERNLVQVNRYRIPIANLPPSFNGFTIAHLTDLHFGPLVSESFIEKIVQRTNKLRTDIIVCTGDFVHERNSIGAIDKVWPILSRLEARHGVYSVLGNHDHWADFDRSLYWLERTEQNIRHDCTPVYKGRDRIVIGGTGDYWEDELQIDKAFSVSDENECRILLCHNPDSIDTKYKTSPFTCPEWSYARRPGRNSLLWPSGPSREKQDIFERFNFHPQNPDVYQPGNRLVNVSNKIQLLS